MRESKERFQVNLYIHELAGGHTLRLHAGKSLNFLSRRVSEEDLETASSFTSLNTAERVINAILSDPRSAPAIAQVRSGLADYAVLTGTGFSRPIGQDFTGAPAYDAKVIITRNPILPEGFLFLTAFPVVIY